MMDGFKKGFSKMLNYKTFLMILIVSIIFIIAAIYTYKQYVTPRTNPSYVANKEYLKDSSDSPKVADLYFFYTNWCPHCKTAKPIWNSFKDEIGSNKVKGYQINFIEVDCEKETAVADKFKVAGYPTIKLIKDNEIVEYDAKPDKATLLEFLQSSL
jgi:thiol-disulfide isomerase/thioredoxin